MRNRDLQSVVDDVQNIINEKLQLPAGYTITYGGQFENLQSAKNRLLIACANSSIVNFRTTLFCF